ncbi:MAG: RNA-protein complex protein Nop10 [Aigarchaeota archaeon]|nr:RNA-protein complex protein Nop10 [Aigarchaeota archaeon]
MRSLINKCSRCGKYTMRDDKCPYCNGEVKSAHPPNISLDHRYLKLIIKTRKTSLNLSKHYKNEKNILDDLKVDQS